MKQGAYSKDLKVQATERFKEFMHSIIGSEPYKSYSGIAKLAEDLKIPPIKLYSIDNGKHYVSVEILAVFSLKFGSKFPLYKILCNQELLSGNDFNLPDGYIAVHENLIKDINYQSDLLKIKANNLIATSLRED